MSTQNANLLNSNSQFRSQQSQNSYQQDDIKLRSTGQSEQNFENLDDENYENRRMYRVSQESEDEEDNNKQNSSSSQCQCQYSVQELSLSYYQQKSKIDDHQDQTLMQTQLTQNQNFYENQIKGILSPQTQRSIQFKIYQDLVLITQSSEQQPRKLESRWPEQNYDLQPQPSQFQSLIQSQSQSQDQESNENENKKMFYRISGKILQRQPKQKMLQRNQNMKTFLAKRLLNNSAQYKQKQYQEHPEFYQRIRENYQNLKQGSKQTFTNQTLALLINGVDNNQEESLINRKVLRSILRNDMKKQVILNNFVPKKNKKTYLIMAKVFALRCMSSQLIKRTQCGEKKK